MADGLSANQDEYYAYDGLNRLSALKRGTLNAGRTGLTTTPTWEEDFNFDPTGNWHGTTTGYKILVNGTTTLDQNRSNSLANEISGITTNSGTAWAVPAYDLNGNATTIPQPLALAGSFTCGYDAWNRLMSVKSGGTTISTYAYDGLTRRVRKVTSVTRDYYYSSPWQVVEERVSTPAPGCPEREFVWGLRHQDDLVLRDRVTSQSSSSSCQAPNERLYALHDAFSATAVVNTAGTVVERYGYDAYGAVRFMDANFGSRSASSYGWETLYDDYRWDSETGLYQVRYRYLHPKLGVWITRDPARELGFVTIGAKLLLILSSYKIRRLLGLLAGYLYRRILGSGRNGINVYAFVANNPILRTDIFGLQAWFPPYFTFPGPSPFPFPPPGQPLTPPSPPSSGCPSCAAAVARLTADTIMCILDLLDKLPEKGPIEIEPELATIGVEPTPIILEKIGTGRDYCGRLKEDATEVANACEGS